MNIKKMMEELEQARDELRLQLHLASKDAEDEWQEVTREWDQFLSTAQFEKSAEEVGEAAKELGLKMKASYDRFKKGLSQ
ncbi:hypothetical protein [Labrenzia sp. 011]|uniref:hypothetical protein n=1 Tax=Labrenzia sp. 011 TaxID=2171494 RepID=UPI000D51456A|nr:hypothetical protein [Labrenzia sp. 011]PVB59848.1 hypothetical protein DCO57_20385 [Labrenzia sp. 011]